MREAHELPAPPARSARHRRRRPGRVADLEVDRVEDAWLVEDDVDDEPVVEEAEVVRPGAPAGRARCCWRRRSRRRSAPGRHRRRSCATTTPSFVLRRGRRPRRRAGRRRSAAPAARAVEERLERGLVEHRRHRPARRAVADAAEAQQRRAGRVAPLVDLGRLADARGARRRCRTTGGCARPRGRSARPAGSGYGSGHRSSTTTERPSWASRIASVDADRAVADDRDVGVCVSRHHAARSGWWPQALMRS